MNRKLLKALILCMVLVVMSPSIAMNVNAESKVREPASYRTVTEIHDWGAAVTKVIVYLGKQAPQNSVSTDTFKVNVRRSDSRLATPLLEEGNRTVTKAYVSDKTGNPAASGKYATLEMEIGPAVSLGSALNYSSGGNQWVKSEYTITQNRDIVLSSGSISGLVVTNFVGETRKVVENFSTGKFANGNVDLTYASYAPKKDDGINPLMIWLHGGGEGGTDATIPLSANKAADFATEHIQSYFGGAYVLVPQTPTRWMDGLVTRSDGTSVYTQALMALIKDYVSKNADIDPNRIYIGGASNGGYMTMLMIRDYPGYFAAAYPVCEGLKDTLITDADINKMKDTPIWFIAAQNDTTLLPKENTIPTYERLIKAGAKNVHMTLFDDVHDTSGLYKNKDGSLYQYNGHWSWIYVYNNEVVKTINGKQTTLMEWLAAQSGRAITADTYVADFGQTVRSFTIEGVPEAAAKVKPSDFTITKDRIDAVLLTEGKSDVTEVKYENGKLTLKVAEFRYFASDFEVLYTGSEKLNLSFSKKQVTSVNTEIADSFQAFETEALKYRLYIPENIKGPMPLVIWAHGGGERGTDNWAQIAANKGATAWVEKFGNVAVLAPQVAEVWDEAQLESMRKIILKLISDGTVDSNRIYGSGASFGGKGIILNAAYNEDLFTAIAPIAPSNDEIALPTLESLEDMPIWISTAFEDTRPTRHTDLIASIKKLTASGNKNAKITLYKASEFHKYKLGFAKDQTELNTEYHHSWVLTLDNQYGIMDWLLNQR